jgi:hypothetical protein
MILEGLVYTAGVLLKKLEIEKGEINGKQAHEGELFYLFASGSRCTNGTGVPEEAGYLCDRRLWVDGAIHRSGWQCYN